MGRALGRSARTRQDQRDPCLSAAAQFVRRLGRRQALTVVNATEVTLAILVIATVVLWVVATVRHATVHLGREPAVG
jgi:hypothetical protein